MRELEMEEHKLERAELGRLGRAMRELEMEEHKLERAEHKLEMEEPKWKTRVQSQ